MDNLEPVATLIGDKDFLSPYYRVLDDAEPVRDQELYSVCLTALKLHPKPG